MPYIGEIPMMFYVPRCGQLYEDIKEKIEENGGLVVDFHEVYTYQIRPTTGFFKASDFYQGSIYNTKWLDDAINANSESPMEIGGQKVIELSH